MQLEVDTSAPTVAKISLDVPAEEFAAEVKNGLKNVSHNVNMKGFRPGKVPHAVLEKKFGDNIRGEVKESYVQRAYNQAIQENSLKPMAHPRLSPEALELGDDGSFKVEFEVPLRPTFDLPDYRGMKVTSELEPVLDEQIDAAIGEVRQQQSTPEPAGDDGIDENGFVVGSLKFLHEEQTVFDRDGMRLNALSVPPGVDGDAFAEGLKGAKEGAELEFDMTLPDFIENEEVRGEPGKCLLKVEQAMNMLPPSDEALFEMLGEEVTDMDSLRSFVGERLGEAAVERENNRQETELLDQVLSACDLELPQAMLEQQTEARLQQVAQQMAQSGNTDEDAIKAAQEEQRETAAADAAKGMKALLVVETIGEKEELLVSNDDLNGELANIAARNQSTLEEVREYYSQNNLGQQLAIEILEKKVRRFLRENADIQVPS